MGECAEWVVLVDESGNFDVPSENVCVGGLVLLAPDSAELAQTLKGAVEQAMPHLRYPPHAALFNWPSFHIMSWHGLPLSKQRRLPTALAGPLERAAKAIAEIPDAPAELKAAARGPSREVLSRCDRWLETRAPVAYRALLSVRDRCYQQLWSVLAHCNSTWGALAIAAVETRGSSNESLDPAADRYLRLLAVLCERLVLLAQLTVPTPRIILRVASRGVLRPEGFRELIRDDLAALVEEVIRLSAPDGGQVEFIPEPPASYSPLIHPGLILADYVVNQLRPILVHRKSSSWSPALRAVRSQLSLPIELTVSGMGKLPTITADGSPRQAIQAVRSGASPPVLAAVQPTWAREQAETWMNLLGKGSRQEVVQ